MMHLVIEPSDALIDVPRRISVSGANPGGEVRLATSTKRGDASWRSEAVFRADADGTVDLTRDAPLSGYEGVSPMGLIWSQRCEAGEGHGFFHASTAEPLMTEITATSGDESVSASFTQRLEAEGVKREDVRAEGLVGTLYLPPGDGPFPAVMILNGSGGGINEPRAALYASHGYAAFALGYFRAPGLSDYISNTPLEYFEKGLNWLRSRVKPQDDFVAISGQSRGGELVLLLGSTYPDLVSAVLAYVPSAFVHGGQSAADPAFGRDGPCWLLNGKPLVHLWQDNKTASWKPYDEAPSPRRHTDGVMTALGDPEAMERARIRVENIKGPVLLISGTDDGAWPSSLFSLMVKERLMAHHHPHDVRWFDGAGTGHSILFPYVPATNITHTHPVSGIETTMGGTPAANAHANEASWAMALDFLANAITKHRSHA